MKTGERIRVLMTSLPLVLAVIGSGAANAARPPYPSSPVQEVADTLHGQIVVDPFRWLEQSDSRQTRGWIDSENALTRSMLDAIPGRDGLRAQLAKLYAISTTSAPRVHQARVFYSQRTGAQNQPVIQMIEKGAAPRAVLDPNPLAADGTVALDWLYPSPDGGRIAYGTSSGGSEHSTLRVRDVTTGRDLAEVIPETEHASVAWDPDGKGFLYTRHPARGQVPPGEEVFHEQVYHHRLGDDVSRDPLVFSEQGRDIHEVRNVSLSSDARFTFLSLTLDWAKNDLYVRTAGSEAAFTPVAVGLDGRVSGDAYGGQLYLLTNVGAPRYRIVSVDPKAPGPEHWRDVVPQQTGVISDFAIVSGRLAVHVIENACSRLRIFGIGGALENEIGLPALGSVLDLSADPAGRDLYFTFTSFTYPSAVYRFSVAEKHLSRLEKTDSAVRPEDYEIRQDWATSKDGTRVPLFVVSRRGLAMDGQRPTWLTGYGGFDVSETPAFRADAFPWLDAGGVYASACLRGGGEFGREWHEAGRLAHKQNVFDDFHACAEHLEHSGITNAQHLAIRGGSNGGLLVGAAMTQRPELYGAVVCQAPLLDMIRYQRFLIARYWIPEYGSSENPDQFKFLMAYSPYQNVRPGVKYPPTLFTVADEDSRVDPLHARKMAALLQTRSAAEAPILIRIETRAGHGAGKPIAKRIDEGVDVLSFMMTQLGIKQGELGAR